MKVCIEKKPDGSFSVYEDMDDMAEQPAGMQGAPMAPENEAAEQKGAQAAPDLQGALMLAAKILTTSENDQQQAAFDQGLAKANPTMAM